MNSAPSWSTRLRPQILGVANKHMVHKQLELCLIKKQMRRTQTWKFKLELDYWDSVTLLHVLHVLYLTNIQCVSCFYHKEILLRMVKWLVFIQSIPGWPLTASSWAVSSSAWTGLDQLWLGLAWIEPAHLQLYQIWLKNTRSQMPIPYSN